MPILNGNLNGSKHGSIVDICLPVLLFPVCKNAQKDAPPESYAHSHEHSGPYGDPDKITDGDQRPDMPAGLDERPYPLADDEDEGRGVGHAGEVGTKEKDGGADNQTDGLIKNELGEEVPPAHVGTQVEAAPRGGSRSRRRRLVRLLLQPVLHRRGGAMGGGQHITAQRRAVASWEPVLQDELDDVADLGADHAVQCELGDLAPVKGRVLWVVEPFDELDNEVGGDLDGHGLASQSKVESPAQHDSSSSRGTHMLQHAGREKRPRDGPGRCGGS